MKRAIAIIFLFASSLVYAASLPVGGSTALPEKVSNKSTDGTLSDNSDILYPTQKAVKTYVDNHSGGGGDVSGKEDKTNKTTSAAALTNSATKYPSESAMEDALYIFAAKYGAIGDGTAHTLTSAGYTLATAQAKWPDVTITSTSQLVDFCALQQAVYDAQSKKKWLVLEGKTYYTGEKIQNTATLHVRGQGEGTHALAFSTAVNVTTIMSNHNGPIWESVNGLTHFEHMAFEYDGDTPGSSQIGLLMGSNSSSPNWSWGIDSVRFSKNYIGMRLESGVFSHIDKSVFRDNKYAGLWIENTRNADQGDNVISNTEFADQTNSSFSHIYLKQGSGLNVRDCKFLGTHDHQIYIDIPATRTTTEGVSYESDISITGSSFENAKDIPVYIKDNITPGDMTALKHVTFSNNQGYTTYDDTFLYINNVSDLTIENNIIANGGTVSNPLIQLRNVAGGVLQGNNIGGEFSSALTAVDVDSTVTNFKFGVNHTSCPTYISGTCGTNCNGETVTIGTESVDSAAGMMYIKQPSTKSGAAVLMDRYAGAASITARRANGTTTSPTQVMSGDALFAFSARPWLSDTSAWAATGSAGFNMYAAENITSTNQGGYLTLFSKPVGSTTLVDRLKIGADGVIEALSGSVFKGDGSQLTSVSADILKGVIVDPLATSNNYLLGMNINGHITTQSAAGWGLGTGTVTSITPGTGFTSSTPITTSGTLNVNVGIGANQIPQYDASSNLGIGTASPITKLDVYSTTAGSNNITSRTEVTSNAAGGLISLRHSNASDTYAAAGDRLGNVQFGSRSGGTNRNGAQIMAYAVSTHSSSNAEGELRFLTTGNTSTTPTLRLQINSDGSMSSQSTVRRYAGTKAFSDNSDTNFILVTMTSNTSCGVSCDYTYQTDTATNTNVGMQTGTVKCNLYNNAGTTSGGCHDYNEAVDSNLKGTNSVGAGADTWTVANSSGNAMIKVNWNDTGNTGGTMTYSCMTLGNQVMTPQ